MMFSCELSYTLFGEELFNVDAERTEEGQFLIHTIHWRGLDLTAKLRSNEIDDIARALYSIYTEPPEPEPEPIEEPVRSAPLTPGTVSIEWLK